MHPCCCCSLRKVKMDQRKLNDNANTLVDMAKVSDSTFIIIICQFLYILCPVLLTISCTADCESLVVNFS